MTFFWCASLKSNSAVMIISLWSSASASGRPLGGMIWLRPRKVVPRSSPTRLAEMDPAEMTAEQKGSMAGRCVRYLFATHGDQMRALEMAKINGDKAIVEAWEKAMASDVFAAGGALIPPEFATGIIDLLYATSVIRGSGVSVWPMNTGSLTAPDGSIDPTTGAQVVNQGATALPQWANTSNWFNNHRHCWLLLLGE